MNKNIILTLCLLMAGGSQLQATADADKLIGVLCTMGVSTASTAAALYLVKDIKNGKNQENKVIKMVGAALLTASSSAAGRYIMARALSDNAKLAGLAGSGIDIAMSLMVLAGWNFVNEVANKLEAPVTAGLCSTGIKGIVTAAMAL